MVTYSSDGCATSADSASNKNHGRTVDTAVLQLIFWGHDWQTASNSSQADITAAVQSILRGPYLSRLSQYGFVSLQLAFPKSILSDPPATYVFSDISKAVWGAISAGDLPQPNAGGRRVVYMVFMPSTSVFNDQSTVAGAHTVVHCAQALPSDTRCSGTTDAAWLAFGTGGQSLDETTRIFAHELVETITDPEFDG